VSNINYLSINENFPVAGQDNDTQTFRDNFDTIKTSLRTAQSEVTALENNTAKVNTDNDFNLNIIENGVLQSVREQKFPLEGNGSFYTEGQGIDWQQGSYQIWRFNTNNSVFFSNLPGDPAYASEVVPVGMGRLTLELYSDGSPRTITFTTSSGTVIKKDPSFPTTVTVSSSTNPVFIEVWRRSTDTIFMRYLGQFA
jgi:hypothetical protein